MKIIGLFKKVPDAFPRPNKYLLMFNWILIFTFLICMKVSAEGYSQNVKIDINLKGVPLKEAFSRLGTKAGIRILFSEQDMPERLISLKAENTPVFDLLNELTAASNLKYNVQENGLIIISQRIDITIRGTVTDNNNMPLPGVSILVKGTTTGTVTDNNGRYSINAASDAVLLVSYISYTKQEIEVKNRPLINIILSPNSENLNEVVVTGYTTQRKKDIIGAVSVVDIGQLKNTPSSNVLAQLQGQASGVTVSSTGDPGSSSQVRIRGFSSYGNNNPLYVIDGVPTTDASRLNPQDVESMQVLKDASSASIYGSRAANGVVIITTKHGKVGQTVVAYDSFTGIQRIPYDKLPKLLNTAGVMEYLDRSTDENYVDPVFGKHGSFLVPEYYVVSNGFKGGVSADDARANPDLYSIANYSNIYQILKTSPGTDWYKAMSQDALIQSHQLSASGGTDKSTYSLGLNYFNQEGTFRYTGYKRYSVRLNSQFSPTNFLTFGENLQMAYDSRDGDTNVTGETSAWANAYRSAPFVPVNDIKGGWGGSLIGGIAGNGFNPVATLYRRKDWTNNTLRAFGNVFAEIHIIKGLNLRSSFGLDASGSSIRQALLREYERPEARAVTNLLEGTDNVLNYTWTNTLTYDRTFGEHNLKLLLGSEAIKNIIHGIRTGVNNFDLENNNFLSLNTGIPRTLGDVSISNNLLSQYTLFSVFGRLDYNYKGKYLLNGTVRRDGSSLFGPESRYGIFPSVGLGWRVSEEDFLKNSSWLTDLKLRAGYGTLGSISNVPALNQYSTYGSNANLNYYDINGSNNSTTQGYGISAIGNRNTKWETSTTINIGADISVLEGKLGMSVDLYQKDTKDLLVPQLRSGLEPLTNKPLINLGTMRNRGIDIQFTNNGHITDDLKYDLNVSFTHYKNELTKLNNEGTAQILAAGRLNNVLITTIGMPISSFYGYQIDGFYNNAQDVANGPTINGAPGRIGTWKYKDVNGDNNTTAADQMVLGSPHPDFQLGTNLGLSYKNFDFTAFLFWNQGNQIFNYTKFFTYMGVLGGGIAEGKLADAWTPQTTATAKTPQIGVGANNGYTSFVTGNPTSFYIEDGSYLRLKTIQLGYTFPKLLVNKLKLSNARIYVQAQNPFTFTKYTGADPDLSLISGSGVASDQNLGVDYSGFPTPRQFIVGLSVSF
jgi:TonB-linked SusC/RagA family outer membrane protein